MEIGITTSLALACHSAMPVKKAKHVSNMQRMIESDVKQLVNSCVTCYPVSIHRSSM